MDTTHADGRHSGLSPRPLRIREHMRQRTGTAVRGAAITLFSQYGFHGTTMRMIAATAGVTSASIYTYYDDKEALLESILEETLVALREAFDAAVAERTGSPRDLLRAALVEHARFHARNRLQVLIADSELRALSAARAERVIALRDDYEAALRELVSGGIASSELRAVDAKVATRVAIAACNSVALWYRQDGGLSVEEVADQTADLIISGLVPHSEGTNGV